MKIQTRYHGEIETNENVIWHFESGIPGFQEEKNFILLPLADEEVFSILQSVSNKSIAFVVAPPFSFYESYDFVIDEATISLLDIKENQEVIALSVLTLANTFEDSTANLQAPILLNKRNKKGKQIILHDSSYGTKHPILKEKVEKG